MSPSNSCLSLATSAVTSPFRTGAFCQTGSLRVADTTYLGRPLSLSAQAPVRADQREPNHSSLRRPSRRASAPAASSASICAHRSRPLPPDWPNQPPRSDPSSPSGSETTPSSETFVLITIFPIAALL